MKKIKSNKFEDFLIMMIGISMPLINLRIELPLYTVSVYMISIFLLTICLFVKYFKFRKLFNILKLDNQDILIYLFILIMLFSTLYSVNQLYGIQRFIKLFIAILFYYLIKKIILIVPDYIERTMIYALRTVPIYILYLTYYYLIKFNVNWIGINTKNATEAGKNSLAFMICIMIAFVITDIFAERSKPRYRIISIVRNLIIIGSVFLIQSRALFLISIIFIIINYSLTSNKLNHIIKVLGILSVILIIINYTISDISIIESSLNRFYQLKVIFSDHGSNIGSLSESRSYMITRSIDLFFKKPLIGVGMGSFMFYGGINTLISHNDYLLVLSEQGLIGITIFMIIILNFFKTSYSNYKIEKTNKNKSLFLAMMGILIYFIFINAYDNILVWTIFAMISSSKDNLRKNVDSN